jgi:N-acetyl-1-D-myo-inositol-2-amino-2-deoxy-alpha-D-glucopyranoside deacetylase
MSSGLADEWMAHGFDIISAMTQPTHTLLSVLAHPDDESFGMGGTLALYAQRGVQTHLICATRGEAGEVDPQYLEGFASISERRESELRCAAGILGLAGVYFLDYRDSGMTGAADNQHPQALAAQPVEAVAAKIANLMRQIEPQVVVTFDPIGGYNHPDHIAIHKATVRAFQLAGDPSFASDLPPYQPQKLYFHTISKTFLRISVVVLRLLGRDPRHFGRNGDIDLQAIATEGNFPTHARIDCKAVAESKNAAAACHASQLGGALPRRGLIARLSRRASYTESFMRAEPEATRRLREDDLFAGVV